MYCSVVTPSRLCCVRPNQVTKDEKKSYLVFIMTIWNKFIKRCHVLQAVPEEVTVMWFKTVSAS